MSDTKAATRKFGTKMEVRFVRGEKDGGAISRSLAEMVYSVAVTAQDLPHTLVRAQGESCAAMSGNWRMAQVRKP